MYEAVTLEPRIPRSLDVGVCQICKFEVLYPVCIFGKWKFADVYIPRHKTVVMVTTYPHSAGWLTQRASFFKDRFKVHELDGYENEDTLNKLIIGLR